ncbi:DEAD/DEAH box helicase [Chelativorans salis]|uniref:DNA 3'-5' helicase n=1 Tax=Chelativorans salis TaxID=2978478 RepID=A0ABT2LP66_9HYPH|nr:DEAD/DEAH box helicase [Chelativorans sp. EGI FJ00035]MCT7376361.1 helicase-related protein [Chelativorans sp. EGI FJ00035]
MNQGGDLQHEPGWVESSIARCTRALASATRAADRLALVRSLIRLRGGRIDLSDLDRPLTLDEFALLSRFGLAQTNSERSLRIIDEEDAHDLIGLGAAFKFDAVPRQAYEPATPDGVLLRLTNHSRYRTATQKAATRALLTQPPGSGLLVSMPTGSGKSLLFQIAANFEREIHSGACAIVVTPTIALALDHERTLSGMTGLEHSKALTGDTPPAETEAIINDFRRGQVPILLLSPEKALNPSILQYLVEAATPHSVEYGLDARLTHIFVDEAHIIESWGRSFRPDFQRLPALLARLRIANPEIRAVLLSATLPDSARKLLEYGWKLDGAWLEVDAKLPRFEHDVVIAHYEWESQRRAALDYLVDRAPRPLIIYTTQIADAGVLYARLRDADHDYARVALFTGDTGSRDRRRIVEDWAKDQIDIVVATSAFGLGIDKADIRSVIHACLPEGPARWYQEIGRASRDNGQGFAACLFVEGPALSDVKQAYSLATSGWLTRELAEERWAGLLKAASNRRYDAEYMQMTLDLDAFREGLRPTAGDWNRGWNMTLLTLMQRAGVLRVLSIPSEGDQPDFSWNIEVRDPRALNGVDDDVWQRISDFRDAELAEARADLDAFVAVMRHPDRACVTRTAFEIIEPRSFAPPCGRCPACRKNSVNPPIHLVAAGLEKFWPDALPRRGRLPADVLLVTPLDADFGRGLPSLIKTLTLVGVDQIVVPHGWAPKTAESMVQSGTRLGFVLDEREWVGGNQLANVTTAILMPADALQAQAMLDRIENCRSSSSVPLLVVARPERVLRGRRLDQTISRYAPYAEDQLLALAGGEDAGR